MDDYDDYCDLIDDDEETIETFKDIKEEYETWLDCYEDVHDEEFFPPRWDKEVYAYAMLDEDQRKKFLINFLKKLKVKMCWVHL